jgi:glycosyltransferase involved in cell wall biosynthesis
MGREVDLPFQLPDSYALALCRIEPENNCHLLLKAFSKISRLPLVFVGNWDASDYGRKLRKAYEREKSCILLSPIYNQDVLYTLRAGAGFYVHGHSAGGTNPSLVEMMHFGVPVLAFDCIFNRYTTHQEAVYFESEEELSLTLADICDDLDTADTELFSSMGTKMAKAAQTCYLWSEVGKHYLDLLDVHIDD